MLIVLQTCYILSTHTPTDRVSAPNRLQSKMATEINYVKRDIDCFQMIT